MYFVGTEEGRRYAVAIDSVDLSVRRRRNVESAVRRGSERVHLELGAAEEERALAVGADAVDLAVISRAEIERAVGRRRDGPDEWRRRFEDQIERGAEQQLAARVDRQVFDFALEEIALRCGLKEFRRRSVSRRGSQGCQQHAREESAGTVSYTHLRAHETG